MVTNQILISTALSLKEYFRESMTPAIYDCRDKCSILFAMPNNNEDCHTIRNCSK